MLSGTGGDVRRHRGWASLDVSVRVVPNPFRESAAPLPGDAHKSALERSLADVWTVNVLAQVRGRALLKCPLVLSQALSCPSADATLFLPV